MQMAHIYGGNLFRKKRAAADFCPGLVDAIERAQTIISQLQLLSLKCADPEIGEPVKISSFRKLAKKWCFFCRVELSLTLDDPIKDKARFS